jgi:DNA-binding IclR family transcriptional regulator
MTTDKVLSILNLFHMDRKVLTVDEMAQLISLPKSTVYRFVRTLKGNGLLMEHSTGRYKLGYKFLDYANIVRLDIKITEIARRSMDELTLEFGETTILGVLSDINVICLSASTPYQPIKVSSEEGEIMPLYCGASSKSILAFQDSSLLDRISKEGHIKRYTNNTLIDKNEILEEMKQIRSHGYARSNSEVDEGVVSLGFPIRNSKGEVFASLAIVGTEYRMAEKDEAIMIGRFKEEVTKIERFL